MAHFAQLDENNVVLSVFVIADEECLDADGVEQEQIGADFCARLYGAEFKWVQTSYNARIRKNFAVIGGTYNVALDAFLYLSPFPSWVLNVDTCQWEPPSPLPDNENSYTWNETTMQWELTE
jgi:hypothetical protein